MGTPLKPVLSTCFHARSKWTLQEIAQTERNVAPTLPFRPLYDERLSRSTVLSACILVLCSLARPAEGNEMWVAPGDTLASKRVGDWATTPRGATRFTFAIPDNMGAFLGAKVVVISKRSRDITYDLYLSMSSDGESHSGFRDAQLGLSASTAKGEMLEIDVSSIFPAGMVPGNDYASLVFMTSEGMGHVRIVGLRFLYDDPPPPRSKLVRRNTTLVVPWGTIYAEETVSCPQGYYAITPGIEWVSGGDLAIQILDAWVSFAWISSSSLPNECICSSLPGLHFDAEVVYECSCLCLKP
jgi:hypothetical protein